MSKYIPLLIGITIIFLIDIYAFQAIRHSTINMSVFAKRFFTIVYWLISAITVGSMLLFTFYSPFNFPQTIRIIWFGAFVIFYLPKLVLFPFLLLDDGGRLIRWIASTLTQKETISGGIAIKRSAFLMQAGLLLSGFMMGGLIYGVFKGGYNYTVRRVSLKLPHLPEAFNGLRIVQISDIHSGSFTGTSPLKRAIEMINAEQADLVFFTGDMVNNETTEVLPYKDVLSKVNAKLGVYAVLGNHDYGDYHTWPDKETKQANLQHLSDTYRDIGWRLLRNENVLIGDEGKQLAIIGMENWGTRFQKYGDMNKSAAGSEMAAVRLLLSHDPSHWEGEVTDKFQNVDVTFSGHTHGAQMGIEIPGFIKWSPSQYLYKQWAGLYQKDNQYLYVNRGLGFLAYPGRLGISPEITVFELLKG